MKKGLLYVPVVLSLVALGAHFLRFGHWIGGIASVALVALLAVRRPWVPRLMQVVLVLGAVEWLRTLHGLAQVRSAMGQPYVRMTVILGAVAAMTFLSALLFQWRPLKKIYQPALLLPAKSPKVPPMDGTDIGRVLGESFAAVADDGALALNELRLPPDAAVLDVGTGNGKFAIYLASQGFRVLTGEPDTDTSRYAGKDWAANAEKAGVRNRIFFEPFDASNMPFDANAFDAVFFFGVLHHIDELLRSDVLRESLRVTKQGGAVVLFEPREDWLKKMWENDPGHPAAAIPSSYLSDPDIRERHIAGTRMDVYIYRRAAR